jgi:hypothetical protein
MKFFFIAWLIILILNQVFIFGACFALYCLLAALPHTGVIAFFIARVFREQKRAEDGETSTDKRRELGALLEPLHPPLTETVANLETPTAAAFAPTVSERIEGVLNTTNEGMEKFNKKLETFNVTLAAKSAYYGEKSFVETMMKLSEHKLELQKDPALLKMYDSLEGKYSDESESQNKTTSEVRELANYNLPKKHEAAENIDELERRIGGVVDNHLNFLKKTKLRLDLDPDLMAIFEAKMRENGGGKILAFLSAAYPKETVGTTCGQTGTRTNGKIVCSNQGNSKFR